MAKLSQLFDLIKTETVEDTDVIAAVRDIEGAPEDVAFTAGDLFGSKGELTLSHVDRGGAYDLAAVNNLSRQTVEYTRHRDIVHVWGTVRPNGSSNSITVGSYWGLSGLPYPAKTFRGGLVAGRVIVLNTDQDFLSGFGNGVVTIGGPDLFRFIITDSGAQTFRDHHFQFSYLIDEEES